MKTTLLSLLAFISIETSAQTIVTNGGFEQWTVGHPDNWTSPNFLDINQTTDKNSGTYAAKLEDITGDLLSHMSTTSMLSSGEHPTYASCYFKFGVNNTSGGQATISITLIDANLQEVMVATQNINTQLTTYTPLVLSFSPLTYTYIPNPTKIKIEVTFQAYGIGHQFFVDDFGYEANTSTEILNSTNANPNFDIYPNPNDGHFKLKNTGNNKISYAKIVNTLGQTIHTIEKSQAFTEENVDLSFIPKGVYFVLVQTDSKSYMKKMVLK